MAGCESSRGSLLSSSLETPQRRLESRRPWCYSTEQEEMLSWLVSIGLFIVNRPQPCFLFRTRENDGPRTQQRLLVVNRAIAQQQHLMLKAMVYQSK
ncbi:hypothetical protein LINPERHAP1_LOCUS22240, partial [Linum perenne]